jgi:hypothetical protein
MQIIINQKGLELFHQELAAKLDEAMLAGVIFAQGNCPIDTSSLQESIHATPSVISTNRIHAQLVAGGEDFTGKLMRTGKLGKYVDYAGNQEAVHGFLVGSIPSIVNELGG